MILDCAGKSLDLSSPCVMGVLNVTPDSFSDGGKFTGVDAAIEHALRMREEGAAIIDIGGESSRPGATAISVQQELDRIMPVLEAITGQVNVPVSIDTSKPEVMQAAAQAGASIINDINALCADGAVEVVAASGLPVCLMHMQGAPRCMQENPQYNDVVADIREFLAQRLSVCKSAGIPESKIIVDPGIGFGKTLAHNLTILRHLESFAALGVPLLIGVSRKSMFGELLNRDGEDRLPASLAAALMSIIKGAAIVRAHDVAATVDVIRVYQALSE
ncbi:MAG: dihydropteroate synthase [Gammaproteobacteria bacterium]|nr:MAG: dihydropteroate synthase [Gammaproteobacteria bacterium]